MNQLEEAYKTLQVKAGSSWDEIVSQHKLLSVVWSPDRVSEDIDKKIAQEEIDRINWAKAFLENNRELVLRIEDKSVHRIDLEIQMRETVLEENANAIYFPRTQCLVQGEQLLYASVPTLVNRWKVTQGWGELWEHANVGSHFFFTS